MKINQKEVREMPQATAKHFGIYKKKSVCTAVDRFATSSLQLHHDFLCTWKKRYKIRAVFFDLDLLSGYFYSC